MIRKKNYTLSLIFMLMFGVILLVGCSNSAPTTSAPSPSPAASAPSITAEKPKPAPTSAAPAAITAAASPSPSQNSKYGGVLKINQPRDVPIIGWPAMMAGISGALAAGYPALETIVGMDTTGKFAPTKLSEAMTVASDGKNYTLTLRKGVKFHDGTDWNAQAAKWNLDQMKASGSIPALAGLTSIDIIDNYNIRVNITKYQITEVYNLALFGGFMVSPTAVQTNGIDWAKTHPVGTGPFKFKKFTPSVSAQYERFDDYWGGKPYLDGIDIKFVADPMTQAMALQSGELDIITSSGPTANDLKAKGYPCLESKTITLYLAPDSSNPKSPFNDKRVRQAVEYAIDRVGIAKSIGLGSWDPLYQIAPSQCTGFVSGLEPRTFNPGKAKQLLSEAGYASGLNIQCIADSGRANKDVMIAVQQNLKDVGIVMNLNMVTSAGWSENQTKGWTNGLIYNSMPYSEPFGYNLQQFFVSKALSFYSMSRPAGFDDLVTQAVASVDFKKAQELTQKAVSLAYDEAMIFPGWVYPQMTFTGKAIKDTGIYTSGGPIDWTPAKAWVSK
jgi:peptide/nickel transport system substrate-binding protein